MNKKTLVFVQDDSISAYSIIRYLLDNRLAILKETIDRLIILGPSGTTWQEEFVSFRLPLMQNQIELDFGDFNEPYLPELTRGLIIPLSDELSKLYSQKYLEKYCTTVNIPVNYWRPTNSDIRVLSSYMPGINDEVDMKSICKLNPDSNLIEDLRNIPKLNIESVAIDCQIVKKYSLDKSLFKDNVKSYINENLEKLNSDVFAVRSLSKKFIAKFYIENDKYYSTYYDSYPNFRPLSSLIFDIKSYSQSHPEDTIFIQPYYEGVEIIVNYYQDDGGVQIPTMFKLCDNDKFQCCYDESLSSLCIILSHKLKLKNFSFRTIKLRNGDYALIDFKYSFNKYLAATLKYQSDFITYELTRGDKLETERKKLLDGKYLTQYTDKIFKSTLIF